MVMSNFGACFRICSTQATPAIPFPTTTKRSIGRGRSSGQEPPYTSCSGAVDAQGPMRDDRDLELLRQESTEWADYLIRIAGNLVKVQLNFAIETIDFLISLK